MAKMRRAPVEPVEQPTTQVQNVTTVLTNPEVAAKYNCTYLHNPIVHVPSIYYGLLSNVTLAGADAMVKQGHKALQPKPVQ